ncbi:MAG TPA: OsmC family protein [Thermoanaerobaculia bacterium]|nr:OsmC family protein [Thermoanaerobaculia bacterium]
MSETVRLPATADPQSSAAERIRVAFERNQKALRLRPGVGRGTATTRVRVTEGLICDVEEGPWRLTVDMGDKHGGTGAGPNPGVLGRAALGSCLAIGYQTWAAHLGVPIEALEVEVQADYDGGGTYATADVPAGYLQVRCAVTVTSPAPDAEVMRVLDEADAHSSYRDVFARAHDVRREVRLRRPGGGDG